MSEFDILVTSAEEVDNTAAANMNSADQSTDQQDIRTGSRDVLHPASAADTTNDSSNVKLRHRPPASAAAASSHRGSFYASGTLSANTSRDHSPSAAITRFVVIENYCR